MPFILNFSSIPQTVPSEKKHWHTARARLYAWKGFMTSDDPYLVQKDCFPIVWGIPSIILPLNHAAYDYEGRQPQRYTNPWPSTNHDDFDSKQTL
jgi:hypothetical protein